MFFDFVGYSGTLCEILEPSSVCYHNPCLHGGVCYNTVSLQEYACYCPVGYRGMPYLSQHSEGEEGLKGLHCRSLVNSNPRYTQPKYSAYIICIKRKVFGKQWFFCLIWGLILAPLPDKNFLKFSFNKNNKIPNQEFLIFSCIIYLYTYNFLCCLHFFFTLLEYLKHISFYW